MDELEVAAARMDLHEDVCNYFSFMAAREEPDYSH